MPGAAIFWLTGLSGAGKSTLAESVQVRLEGEGRRVLIVDGDSVRRTVSRDLGFSRPDIIENNTRIAALCAARRSETDIILVPVIAPFRDARQAARRTLSPGFHEVYVKAQLDVLEARDVKGLYARAARGEIDNLIGVSPSSPYEPPEAPDLVIDTTAEPRENSVDRLYKYILSRLGVAAGTVT